MLNMSKKNGAPPLREGTAAAVRDAAGAGAIPAPATAERPLRRSFTAEYKLRIVREADAAAASGVDGSIGALLRKEGLYSSHLTEWRRERDSGALAGLTPKTRGRKPTPKNPLADENEQLRRQNVRLQAELDKAKIIIDVQKKLSSLLGIPMPETSEKKS
jgi:transposase